MSFALHKRFFEIHNQVHIQFNIPGFDSILSENELSAVSVQHAGHPKMKSVPLDPKN